MFGGLVQVLGFFRVVQGLLEVRKYSKASKQHPKMNPLGETYLAGFSALQNKPPTWNHYLSVFKWLVFGEF